MSANRRNNRSRTGNRSGGAGGGNNSGGGGGGGGGGRNRGKNQRSANRPAQRDFWGYSLTTPDAVARIDYIALNLLRPPLDDKNLRQAINFAVDKDSILQNVLFGAGKLATSYLPLMPGNDPNSPGYRLILNNVLFPAAKKKKQKT